MRRKEIYIVNGLMKTLHQLSIKKYAWNKNIVLAEIRSTLHLNISVPLGYKCHFQSTCTITVKGRINKYYYVLYKQHEVKRG